MYSIVGLTPRTDIQMGHHGFGIDLHPDWPQYVERSKLTNEKVQRIIETSGPYWLDGCGYATMHQGKRLFEARSSIRVAWGKWGVEHLYVPGDACGLDITDDSFGCVFEGGRRLLPHNIDSWKQKNLLLIAFTEIAYSVMLFARS